MTHPTRRTVFFHVPKCGGSSTYTDLRAKIARRSILDRLTGKRWAVLLHTKYHASSIEALYPVTRTARFVHGHIDWGTYKKIGEAPSDYLFTFLRIPAERLMIDIRYFGSEQG